MDAINQNPTAENMQIFSSAQFGQMRVQSNEKGQAWFCLSDVCRVLSLTNSSEVKKRLKQPGIITAEVGVQTGTKQDGSPAIQLMNLTFRYFRSDGTPDTSVSTVWTEKGRMFLHNFFANNNMV